MEVTPIIIVHYIKTNDLSYDEIREVVKSYKNNVATKELGSCFCYFIPTEGETRVECINPKLVSENDYADAKAALEQHKKLAEKASELLLPRNPVAS